MRMTWKLITISISHFCEKARWALDRSGIAYTEEGHIPLFHVPYALSKKKTRTTPILVHDHGTETDSTDILRFIDEQVAEPKKLFPCDTQLRDKVVAWEERFDRSLGPATRRWAYFHLLPHRKLTLEIARCGASMGEYRLLQVLFPLFRRVLRKGLAITPEKSAQSLEKIHSIFSEVSEALADGRRYLVGDRFTAADLTFAALASPALLPAEHPLIKIDQNKMPDSMRDEVEKLRATRAGLFALRLYTEERKKA
jgi:glutathione S-transferase